MFFRLTSISILATGLIVGGIGQSAAQSWLEKGKSLLEGATKAAPSGSTGGVSGLATDEIIAGLKEALKVGTERVVGTVGRENGFNNNSEIHIPLPDTLAKVQSTLRSVGASGLADDLELKLNRAAEAATPRAKEVFWNAITDMSLDDAKRIYEGPKDAATQYFKGKMSGPLTDSMRPVVDSTLSEVGAIQAYDSMMGQYKAVPFVPDVKADLTTHVLERALDALFLYLAREEAAIRENPVKRSTALLQKVFGAGS
ncbi:MAG: DUF4197 domain-containing protein [Rhodospirillaceae bacterium]|nr:DUF4197 domain-containing protein [Rhodospirillaceae bacterium]